MEKMMTPKDCPCCGSKIEGPYSWYAGDEDRIYHKHPLDDCVLSGFEVYAHQISSWNTRFNINPFEKVE